MGVAFDCFEKKMREAGLEEPARRAFRHSLGVLERGESGMIPETELEELPELPVLEEIRDSVPECGADLLGSTAILKLNGGLGTGMGLEKAKSLLVVRNEKRFLDLTARQVVSLRERSGVPMRLLLMNSFSTSADTREWLARWPQLGTAEEIELLQNKVPKVDAETLSPVEWPSNPALEWCPPGHGDLYTVLGTGETMEHLLADGIRFLFVSNSDNLGATPDPALLSWFEQSGAPFAMEVTARTESDRKGGHLAVSQGRLLLRESAQCPEEDLSKFQDIARHRFFNTNNLWLRLDALRDSLREHGGFLPLPVIRNKKTVDPRDSSSPAVIQLETAMGAAIASFPDSAAIVVPRSRFAPVKTTSDLLALRSDAYEITADGRVELVASRGGVPPNIQLDSGYKLVDSLEEALAAGVPSLRECDSLQVSGPFRFSPGTVFRGEVSLENPGPEPAELPPITLENTRYLHET